MHNEHFVFYVNHIGTCLFMEKFSLYDYLMHGHHKWNHKLDYNGGRLDHTM